MKKSAVIFSLPSLFVFIFFLSISISPIQNRAIAPQDTSEDLSVEPLSEDLGIESSEEPASKESVKQKVVAATTKVNKPVTTKEDQKKKEKTKERVIEAVEGIEPEKSTGEEEAVPDLESLETPETPTEKNKTQKEKTKERVVAAVKGEKAKPTEEPAPDELELPSLDLELPGEPTAAGKQKGAKPAATKGAPGEELGTPGFAEATPGTPELEGLGGELELPEIPGEEFALPEIELEIPTELEAAAPEEEFVMTMSFGVPIPHIGTIVLDGFANFDKGTFGLSKTIAGWEFGPLEFDPLYIALTTDKGLTASTKAHLFGYAARLALDSLNITEIGPDALFSLSLDKIIDVPITPWKKVPISCFNLHLTSGLKELYTLTTISKPNDTKFSVNLGPEKYISLYSKSIDPSTILGFLKGTDIEAIQMSECEIRVYNPFAKGVASTVAIGALLILSNLDMGLSTSFQGLYATATLDKEHGFNLMALLPTFTIPYIGPVTNGKIRISNQAALEPTLETQGSAKTSTFLSIEGLASINLPLDLGTLDTLISATLDKKKFSFSALINKDLQVGDMPIVQPKILFSTDGNAEIVGGLHIGELEAYAHLKAEKKDGKQIVTFYGTLKNDVPMKPFASVPGLETLPGIKDLAINKVKLGISASKNIYFEGMVKIFGLELNSRFKKTAQGASLWAETPPDYSLSNLIPDSKGTILDQLTFQQMWIAASSADYYDKDYDAQVKKGFTLVADIQMTGAIFGGLKQLLVGAPDVLKLHVSLGKSFKDMYFLINVPMEIKLSDIASLKGVGIHIQGAPPTAGGIAQIHVKPTPSELLIFTAEFSVDATQAKIAGTMEGVWQNPLGVKGFSIGNLAAEIGMVLVAPLPILGVTGEIEIGSKKVAMALKVSPNLIDIILMGKVNELGIGDLIALANVAGASIPQGAIPPIGFKDVEVIIAPKGGSIGRINFDPGFTVKGLMEILGINAKLTVSLGMEGILAQGIMKKIALGPLEVTRGATLIPLKGEEDYDGPVARLAINLKEQHIYISGRVSLLSLTEEVDILVNKDGYSFKMEGHMYGIYKVIIESKSVGSGSSLDFWMKATMDMSFIEQLQQKTTALLDAFQKEARAAFNNAQDEVRKCNSEIEKYEGMINERQQKIDELTRDINRKNEAAKEQVRSAKRDVEDAQSKVNSLQNRIDDLNRQIDNNKRKLSVRPAVDYGIDEPFIPQGTLLASNDNGLGALSLASMNSSSFLNDISDLHQYFKPEKIKTFALKGFEWAESAWEGTKDVATKGVEGAKDVGEKAYEGGKDLVMKAYYAEEVARLGIEVGLVYGTKGLADGALEIAKGALTAAEAMAFDPTIAKEAAEITLLGTELAGLEVPRGAAIAGRETANGILEGLKQTAIGISEAGKWTIAAAGEIIKLKKASIEGSVGKLVSGELPIMKVDAVILGKEREVEFTFDVKDIPKSIESMAIALFNLVKP